MTPQTSMPLAPTLRAVPVLVAAALFFCPLLVAGAACGTFGILRHPHQLKQYHLPGNSKIGLVAGCQRACLAEGEPCQGFTVNLSSKMCRTLSAIMEKQGEGLSDSYDTLHYDLSCFYDISNSSSTQIAHHLENTDDAYTCIPSTEQAVYNPSFETGVWTGYAHGWSLRGSTKENVPRRSAIGHAIDSSTNMVFESRGNGTSTISQTLCVVPELKYELSAFIGHISATNFLGQFEYYYHAPTLSVYLDRDLIFRNSVCGPKRDVLATECHPSDGTYYPLSKIVKPLRSSPTLTFQFQFDAPPGKKSYKALLDLVQLVPAEPPI